MEHPVMQDTGREGQMAMAKGQDPVNLILTVLIRKISIFLKYLVSTL